MSDMKDKAVEITLNGITYNLVFDLNVVEEVTEVFGSIGAFTKTLFEDGKSSIGAIKMALTALTNEAVEVHNETHTDKMQKLNTRQIGRLLLIEDQPIIKGVIMEALRRSLPRAPDDELKN